VLGDQAGQLAEIWGTVHSGRRSSKKDNLGNGKTPAPTKNWVHEGRELVGKHFASAPLRPTAHGESEWRLHRIPNYAQKSTLRTDEHNQWLKNARAGIRPQMPSTTPG
jgi:hypothetical protein